MTKVTVKAIKKDIVYRLAAIIESQSAAISPRTNEIIEASRAAKEEIERLRQNIQLYEIRAHKLMITPQDCPWCGQYSTHFDLVHGHYQCPVCKRPISDCCNGERIENEQKTLPDRASAD